MKLAGTVAEDSSAIEAFVGNSAGVKEIRSQIREVAGTNLGILISGPNGTGKELIARAVHAFSGRASKPFIAVDCASAIGDIFPSHLFGQIKGAFTGAVTSLGCFRSAQGGTLFLDEIGELSPQMQAQLLRVLEEKSVVPVGAVNAILIDTRVIAATNRDLHEDILAGRFRRDLYHRLNMVELKTIPLKDHPGDIELLAQYFLAATCLKNDLPNVIIDAKATLVLLDYDWPGNVRELRNVIERVLLANQGSTLTPRSIALLRSLTINHDELPQSAAGSPSTNSSFGHGGSSQQVVDDAASAGERGSQLGDSWLRLADLERYHIQQTLEHTLHNETAAASLLGITRRVLHRLMKIHGLDMNPSPSGDSKKRMRPPKERNS